MCPSLLPAGLSMILMIIIRYISAVLVWILTAMVVLGSLGELTSCLTAMLGGHFLSHHKEVLFFTY